MKPTSKDHDPKWGFWDITDEQAEKINNGDVDEYNAFFVRNYNIISGLAYNEWRRLTYNEFFQSIKEKEDIINAFYFDLRCSKIKSGALLCHLLHLSALAVDRSTYQMARKLSPHTLDRSYEIPFCFIPTEVNKNELRIDEAEYCSIIDLYEYSPSPQEEIDLEESRVNVPELAKALDPFVTPKARKYLEFFLDGLKPAHAEQRLHDKGGASAYNQIKRGLITNYLDVLKVLTDTGYQIPPYLANELPDKYEEYVLPKLNRERKRQEAQAEKERKARERAKRAETRKERLREYNREYKRRQRAQAKTASASETA